MCVLFEHPTLAAARVRRSRGALRDRGRGDVGVDPSRKAQRLAAPRLARSMALPFVTGSLTSGLWVWRWM